MPMIKCPDCLEAVSNKAISCPRCGCPLRLKEMDIQVISRTSKKLKLQTAIWSACAVGSILLMMIAAMTESLPFCVLTFTGFMASVVGMVVTRIRIWWEHE